ncbi:MAG: methylmalonyl Co-A mutase-associated GTPase MeaB [Pseudomonadota bacterium]
MDLDTLRTGGKGAVAQALAALERRGQDSGVRALLHAAYLAPRAQVIGFTGPPGVGKSTLLGQVIAQYRQNGQTVGVIAVDPSSKRSGGALLGDRLRLRGGAEDQGVFVRSMAARDRLGGLADLTVAAMVLMRAVYDRVLIETVGVGQSETDVAGVADTVIFCIQPGSGDSLQFMKAGIMEIPHIAVVTKSDLGATARRALADLRGALSLSESAPSKETPAAPWQVRALSLSAQDGQGIGGLVEQADAHFSHLQHHQQLLKNRHEQALTWLRESLRDQFGREGLRKLGQITLDAQQSPFVRADQLAAQISQSPL